MTWDVTRQCWQICRQKGFSAFPARSPGCIENFLYSCPQETTHRQATNRSRCALAYDLTWIKWFCEAVLLECNVPLPDNSRSRKSRFRVGLGCKQLFAKTGFGWNIIKSLACCSLCESRILYSTQEKIKRHRERSMCCISLESFMISGRDWNRLISSLRRILPADSSNSQMYHTYTVLCFKYIAESFRRKHKHPSLSTQCLCSVPYGDYVCQLRS